MKKPSFPVTSFHQCLVALILSMAAFGFAADSQSDSPSKISVLHSKSDSKAKAEPEPEPELILYAFHSFMGHEGLGQEVIPIFEKKHHCHIRPRVVANSGQLLSRLELDAKRGKQGARLVIGLDQYTWDLARPWLEGWGAWIPNGMKHVPTYLFVDPGFLPFDYGVLALMADLKALTDRGLTAPHSLPDLLKPEWKRNLILEDPRTSTPGLSFFLFVLATLGERSWDFWKGLQSQWLTLTPGWEGAYSLFVKKEAPLVWSYISSQAYHVEHPAGDSTKQRYKALLFDEGQPLQIEGAALVKAVGDRKTDPQSNQQLELARAFLEFLISPEVQSKIPQKLWMYPVRDDVGLPPSFQGLPKPKRVLTQRLQGQDIKNALKRWAQAMSQ